jgi:hypothetical protein
MGAPQQARQVWKRAVSRTGDGPAGGRHATSARALQLDDAERLGESLSAELVGLPATMIVSASCRRHDLPSKIGRSRCLAHLGVACTVTIISSRSTPSSGDSVILMTGISLLSFSRPVERRRLGDHDRHAAESALRRSD